MKFSLAVLGLASTGYVIAQTTTSSGFSALPSGVPLCAVSPCFRVLLTSSYRVRRCFLILRPSVLRRIPRVYVAHHLSWPLQPRAFFRAVQVHQIDNPLTHTPNSSVPTPASRFPPSQV